tara:strand:- start:569 stop:1357 length:789 start_codon:yes stop_codon:yes gene_type:complete
VTLSLLNQVTTHREINPDVTMPPVRMNIQGTDGIGKSTFGANAPGSIFIQAEDGLSFITVPRFEKANTWEDLLEQVKTLALEDHPYKTVVLDTTDAAAKLGEAYVCEKNGWSSAADPKAGYGAFYVAEENAWLNLLNGLNVCFKERDMNVILLSHVVNKDYKPPESEGYNRWEMRCNRKINSLIKDWVDFNLFANYETTVIKDGSKSRGQSYGNRALHTKFEASHDAKSRLELPSKLEFTWQAFADAYGAALGLPANNNEAA